MKEKFKLAVNSGIICGIALVILSFLYFTVSGLLRSGQTMNTQDAQAVTIFFTIVILALNVFTFFCAGVLLARLATKHMINFNDAVVLAAITAGIGELINLPFTIVLAFVTEYIWPGLFQSTNTSPAVSATISAGGQLICCFPVLLVVGIIVSILGAAVYTMLRSYM